MTEHERIALMATILRASPDIIFGTVENSVRVAINLDIETERQLAERNRALAQREDATLTDLARHAFGESDEIPESARRFAVGD
jgi:hypothetical protein